MVVRRLRLASSLLGVSLITACSALPGEDQAASSEAVAVAGRWRLPADVAAAASATRLKYDGAPNWSSRACSGKLKTGADRLGDYLEEQFAAISSVGGYACRQNTANRSKMSVHGTGRALDIFIPKVGGAADNGKGDAVANWLVLNAAKIGVQLVIWDRTVWQANGKSDKQYGGPHPHDDHLHVELTIPGSEMKTPWFREVMSGDAGSIDLEPDSDTDTDTDTNVPPAAQSDAGTPPPPPPPPPPDDEPEPEPDEPEPPPDPTPIPGSEPAPPPDTPDTTAPSDGADGPTSDELEESSEEPLFEDEPAEGESEGPTKKSSKRRRVGPDVASSGCSASPGTEASHTRTLAVPLALALAGVLVRRRRRAG